MGDFFYHRDSTVIFEGLCIRFGGGNSIKHSVPGNHDNATDLLDLASLWAFVTLFESTNL